jgi:hypothetical protein
VDESRVSVQYESWEDVKSLVSLCRLNVVKAAPDGVRLPSLRFALQRSARLRSALQRHTQLRFARRSLALRRFAPLRSSPLRSARLRFGRSSGFFFRHPFHAATPCRIILSCSSSATDFRHFATMPTNKKAANLAAETPARFLTAPRRPPHQRMPVGHLIFPKLRGSTSLRKSYCNSPKAV